MDKGKITWVPEQRSIDSEEASAPLVPAVDWGLATTHKEVVDDIIEVMDGVFGSLDK